MTLRRLADAFRDQSWFTVALEIMIVVIGIFIGLQVDGWGECSFGRLLFVTLFDRSEKSYLMYVRRSGRSHRRPAGVCRFRTTDA